jgi:hypothetical protein
MLGCEAEAIAMLDDPHSSAANNQAPPAPRAKDQTSGGRGAGLQALLDLLGRFFASGVFFMIVGAVLLRIAYDTIGVTHTAMTFVFVVVGVAILLYGTGTQGIAGVDPGGETEKIVRYHATLAGGAGALAFCVAAGIIAFPLQIKGAFLPNQNYIRLVVRGDTGFVEDIGHYRYVASVNSTRVPAVQRDDYIEIFAPYLPGATDVTLDVTLNLHLVDAGEALQTDPKGQFSIVIKSDRSIVIDGTPSGAYHLDSVDFPKYELDKRIPIQTPKSVGGVIVR